MRLNELLNGRFKSSTLMWYPAAKDDLCNLNHPFTDLIDTIDCPALILTDLQYEGGNGVDFTYLGKEIIPAALVPVNSFVSFDDLPMFGNMKEWVRVLQPPKEEVVKKITPLLPEDESAFPELMIVELLSTNEFMGIGDYHKFDAPFFATSGQLVELQEKNMCILVLNCSNESFYKYCSANKINIHYVIVNPGLVLPLNHEILKI